MSATLRPTSIYLAILQKQEGPYTVDQVAEKFRENKISAETLAWHSGLPEWTKISALGIWSEIQVATPPLLPNELPPCEKILPSSGELLGLAFRKTKEHWWRIALAGCVYMLISGLIQAPSQMVSQFVFPQAGGIFKNLFQNIGLKTILFGFLFFVVVLTVMTYLNNLIAFGFYRYVLGILRGEKDRLERAQQGILGALFPALLYTVVAPLIVMVGFLFFIFPGIYLGIGYLFAPLLIVDQKLSFWEALETSRKLVHPRWGRVFWSMILLGFVVLSGILLFFVGLFFTIPMALVGFLIVYEYLLREHQREVAPKKSEGYQDVMAANLFVFPGLGTWWIGETKLAVIQMLGATMGFLISLYGMGEVGMAWIHQSREVALALLGKSAGWTILGGLIFFKAFWAWGFWTAWSHRKKIKSKSEPEGA
jgi:hypothetical protein